MSKPNNVFKYTSGFSKSVRRLPADVKRKLTQALETLARDPFDNGLQLEKLKSRKDQIFSVRLNREFRLIFRRPRCGIIELLCAGNHEFAYRPY